MKVAFLVHAFPKISETFILNQIVGLIERGHEVHIYCQSLGDTVNAHPLVNEYSLLQKVYVLCDVPSEWFIKIPFAILLWIYYLIRRPKVALRIFNFLEFGKDGLKALPVYTVVPFNGKDYDIVHAQFGTISFLARDFQIANCPRAKLVVTFRGLDITKFIEKKGHNIYSQVFQYADRILVVSSTFKEKLILLGCPPEKIDIHRSGVNFERFPFLPNQSSGSEKVRILTVGLLVEKKGFEFGIKAVSKISKNIPNIEYTIVGDGILMDELKLLVKKLNLESTVRLVGSKTEPQVVEYLSKSDIFLAPNVTARDGNQEGIPNTIKEAMAVGLPIVSTFHSGIPELVEDGVSGFLVAERDIDALAEKLDFLIKNPQIWSDMGAAGRNFVQQHYDLNSLNDQLVEIYK